MLIFTSTCSLMNLSYFYEMQVKVTLEEEDCQVEWEEEEEVQGGWLHGLEHNVITVLCALLVLYDTTLLDLYRIMLHFVRSVCTMLLLDYVIKGR
jgi:hypothetical protein